MKGMKGMKKIVMVLMVLSMIVVFAAPASAKRYVVDVISTQVLQDGTVELYATGDGGKNRTFIIPVGAAENRMLAMAMCAQSTGMQLKIQVVVFQDGQEITEMQLLTTAP